MNEGQKKYNEMMVLQASLEAMVEQEYSARHRRSQAEAGKRIDEIIPGYRDMKKEFPEDSAVLTGMKRCRNQAEGMVPDERQVTYLKMVDMAEQNYDLHTRYQQMKEQTAKLLAVVNDKKLRQQIEDFQKSVDRQNTLHKTAAENTARMFEALNPALGTGMMARMNNIELSAISNQSVNALRNGGFLKQAGVTEQQLRSLGAAIRGNKVLVFNPTMYLDGGSQATVDKFKSLSSTGEESREQFKNMSEDDRRFALNNYNDMMAGLFPDDMKAVAKAGADRDSMRSGESARNELRMMSKIKVNGQPAMKRYRDDLSANEPNGVAPKKKSEMSREEKKKFYGGLISQTEEAKLRLMADIMQGAKVTVDIDGMDAPLMVKGALAEQSREREPQHENPVNEPVENGPEEVHPENEPVENGPEEVHPENEPVENGPQEPQHGAQVLDEEAMRNRDITRQGIDRAYKDLLKDLHDQMEHDNAKPGFWNRNFGTKDRGFDALKNTVDRLNGQVERLEEEDYADLVHSATDYIRNNQNIRNAPDYITERLRIARELENMGINGIDEEVRRRMEDEPEIDAEVDDMERNQENPQPEPVVPDEVVEQQLHEMDEDDRQNYVADPDVDDEAEQIENQIREEERRNQNEPVENGPENPNPENRPVENGPQNPNPENRPLENGPQNPNPENRPLENGPQNPNPENRPVEN
ncbi:MAG: hypothetical protein PUC28_04300, partial [Blautia sp.]|nr:hypothetical protein [Blautia sp.]